MSPNLMRGESNDFGYWYFNDCRPDCCSGSDRPVDQGTDGYDYRVTVRNLGVVGYNFTTPAS